ncbi:MAG: ABC transporter ATP-binding protein [Pseudomonadota bacterium]
MSHTESESETPVSLWQITAGQRHRYLAAVAAMVLTNLFLFAPPLLGKYAIDVVTGQDAALAAPLLAGITATLSGSSAQATALDPSFAHAYLWLSGALILLLTGIAGYFTYLRGRFAAQASERIVSALRERLYGQLHDLPAAYYDTADTGDLVQRASSDVETLRVFLDTDIVEIARTVLMVLCVMPILFSLDWRLASSAVVLMPALIVGAWMFFERVKVIFQGTDEAEAAMTATLQENLTGIRVVRAFNRQRFEIERFSERNREFRDRNYRLIRLMGFYWSLSDMVAFTQIGIVLFYGAWLTLNGALSVGTLFAFMTYIAMVIWPIRQLGRILTDSGKAVISLGRIDEVLASTTEPARPRPAVARVSGRITIEDLTMRYGSAPALDGLSLDIAAGETLGIVGAPGSGKSSLIRVLLGLYPYQQGHVRLDDQEISEVDRHWLREQISVVLQEPFLYSRTIAENLRVGDAAASDARLEAVLADAAATETLAKFAAGLDAPVGERGVTLSGGQRQRLALARALLKEPPILVLDDALSAVDLNTEAQILTALRRRSGAQTTLIIAHRLSSVMHADRIAVLAGGRLVQLGDHNELRKVAGPYRDLCDVQLALEQQVEADLAGRAANLGGGADDGGGRQTEEVRS